MRKLSIEEVKALKLWHSQRTSKPEGTSLFLYLESLNVGEGLEIEKEEWPYRTKPGAYILSQKHRLNNQKAKYSCRDAKTKFIIARYI